MLAFQAMPTGASLGVHSFVSKYLLEPEVTTCLAAQREIHDNMDRKTNIFKNRAMRTTDRAEVFKAFT